MSIPKPNLKAPKPTPMILKHNVSPGGLYPNNKDNNAKILTRRPCQWGENENKVNKKLERYNYNYYRNISNISNKDKENKNFKNDEYTHNLEQQIYFLELEIEHLKTKGVTQTNIVQGKQALDVKFVEFKSIFDELKQKSNKKLIEKQKEIEVKDNEIKEKVSKIVTLKNDLEVVTRDRDNIEIQYNKLREELAKADHKCDYELNLKQKKYDDLYKRYEQLRSDIVKISTEYNVFYIFIQIYKKHTEDNKNSDKKDIDTYKRYIEKYNKERADLLEEKTQLEIAQHDYETKIDSLNKSLDKAKIDKANKDEELMKCQNELNELFEENKLLKGKNEQLVSALVYIK